MEDYLTSLADRISSINPEEADEDLVNTLSSLGHHDLLQLRGLLPSKSKQIQNFVAPFEHMAFAREYTEENPLTGSLGVAVATPAYYAAKLLGLSSGRSDPSLREVASGYRGIGQGLAKYFTK